MTDFEDARNATDKILEALKEPVSAVHQLSKAAREGDSIDVHESLRDLKEKLLGISRVVEKTEKDWVSSNSGGEHTTGFEDIYHTAGNIRKALTKMQRVAAQLRKAAENTDAATVRGKLRELHEELLKMTCLVDATEKAWVSR